MFGIAVITGSTPHETIPKMVVTMHHCGPDDSDVPTNVQEDNDATHMIQAKPNLKFKYLPLQGHANLVIAQKGGKM